MEGIHLPSTSGKRWPTVLICLTFQGLAPKFLHPGQHSEDTQKISGLLWFMWEIGGNYKIHDCPPKIRAESNTALINLFLVIIFRERGRKRERKETSICCSTYSCIHWLLLVYVLTGDRTCNLAVLRQHSNQLSTQPGMDTA